MAVLKMKNPKTWSIYDQFNLASNEAREIAREFSVDVAVKNFESEWFVVVPGDALERIAKAESERLAPRKTHSDSDIDWEMSFDERDERQSALDEMHDLQDSWALSESDGWFYAD